jgi:hypothetical protein
MKKNFLDITTFEEILEVTGRPSVPEFNELPEDLRAQFQNHYMQMCIAEAANGKVKLDWNNQNQRKYIPYFWCSPSGVSFDVAYCLDSFAYAGGASRLCFVKREHAAHAGKTFTKIYEDALKK